MNPTSSQPSQKTKPANTIGQTETSSASASAFHSPAGSKRHPHTGKQIDVHEILETFALTDLNLACALRNLLQSPTTRENLEQTKWHIDRYLSYGEKK